MMRKWTIILSSFAKFHKSKFHNKNCCNNNRTQLRVQENLFSNFTTVLICWAPKGFESLFMISLASFITMLLYHESEASQWNVKECDGDVLMFHSISFGWTINNGYHKISLIFQSHCFYARAKLTSSRKAEIL